MKFSTKDQDNDPSSANCAVASKGSWWYKDCKYSNLNGQYFTTGEISNPGMTWYYWKSDGRYMKKTEMKTRPEQL
jgi:ficolin